MIIIHVKVYFVGKLKTIDFIKKKKNRAFVYDLNFFLLKIMNFELPDT